MNKVIRSICYFSGSDTSKALSSLDQISNQVSSKGYTIQTRRICSPNLDELKKVQDPALYISLGTIAYDRYQQIKHDFFAIPNLCCNIDLTHETIDEKYTDLLFEIIKTNASKTFNTTFVFNNNNSSPFFPSGSYNQDGFSLGLQPTDLSVGCNTLEEWLERMKGVWTELTDLMGDREDFLGIDSSVAPLLDGDSSFIHFIRRLGYTFEDSVITPIYTQITDFIKTQNPKPIGLCGLMFPCLEDYLLAEEYEKGNFSIERNIYLSLHSGLGIDTYPIGIDEKPEKIVGILKLIQALSNKYNKPLSARFVADGKAHVGQKTNFKNQFLKDVVLRAL